MYSIHPFMGYVRRPELEENKTISDGGIMDMDYQSPYFQLIINSWGSSNSWDHRVPLDH